MFNITNNDNTTILISDGFRDSYIPKFRLYMEVDEPFITIYWTDSEKGKAGILRKIVLNYNDVMFGYLTPTSASEVELVIQGYIDSAWDDIINDLNNYVPYVGATQNVDLGTYGLDADFVAFSLSPVNSPGAGQIAYDGTTGTLSYLLNNSNVVSNIGQTLHAYVHNAEGSPISKGDAVYLYQASGNKASVKLARNLSDSTSAKTLGLCAEDIGTNQNGMVICQGKLTGLNTSMFGAGDTLYLANTYGDYTNVKPYAPEHLVYIGVVERANAGAGEIYVRPQNGYELNEIHDVQIITTPTDGDVLTYEASTSLWKAKTPTSGSGITSLNSQTGTTQTFASGSSGTDFNISSATNTHTFNLPTASATNRGLLSTSDWSTFNSKEPALTKGNLTEATSSVLTISGGTSAVIGSGTSIQVKQANGSQSGFLATADWTTFNGKQDALVSGTNIKTVNGISILGSGDLDTGYTLSVQALTSSPVDAQTIYFGNLPKAPVTTAAISKVYIPRTGSIKRAEIYCYSGTAGTSENWSCYIRLNNSTDTLVQTIGAATNERRFNNSSLSISVVAGDYIEIKFINPTWATNPLTTIFGGYIYIE
jgi:hypothetical protein